MALDPFNSDHMQPPAAALSVSLRLPPMAVSSNALAGHDLEPQARETEGIDPLHGLAIAGIDNRRVQADRVA